MRRIARLFSLMLCVLCAGAVSAIQAKEPQSPAETYGGFFISLAAGPALVASDIDTHTTIDFIESQGSSVILHSLAYFNTLNVEDINFPGRASVGYGGCIGNCWYVGLELSVFGSGDSEVTEETEVTEELDTPDDGATASVTWKNSVTPKLGLQGALDFKTGFFLSQNFLLYGRVGLAAADVEITSILDLTTVSGNDITLTGDADLETTDSEVAFGLNLGVGVEQLFSPEFGVVLEYTYVDYGNFTANHEVVTYTNTGLPGTTTGTMTSDTTITLSQQTLWIGAYYHF